MPLEFSVRERALLSTKLMVQAPAGVSVSQLARIRRDMDRAVMGLPGDVFMALDALRLHAEQGNNVAKDLFDSECTKLGLTRPFHSFAR